MAANVALRQAWGEAYTPGSAVNTSLEVLSMRVLAEEVLEEYNLWWEGGTYEEVPW